MGYKNSYKSIDACIKSIRKNVIYNDVAAVCTEDGGKTYFFVEHSICVEYRRKKDQLVKEVRLNHLAYPNCNYCKMKGSQFCENPGYC